MRVPFRFQTTEYDCGPTSLQNAFIYLYDRERIPAEIIKKIYAYTLDCDDELGNPGEGGTSREALVCFTNWLSSYSRKQDLGITCSHLENEKVTYQNIALCCDNGGCVVLRTVFDVEHYVLITKVNASYVYLWDPYYLDKKYFNKDKDIYIILNEDHKYNRKIKTRRFISCEKLDFALGPIENRECLLLNIDDD